MADLNDGVLFVSTYRIIETWPRVIIHNYDAKQQLNCLMLRFLL